MTRKTASDFADRPDGRALSAVFAGFVRAHEGHVTLAELTELLGDRSLAGLLLLLALPMWIPVPAPGISIAFGLPMILLSAQLALGRRQVWLPQSLARRSIAEKRFASIVRTSLPALRRLETIVKPRMGWLAGPWASVPVGLICCALAVVITLPIPLGHFVPGTAISLFALGLLERDGLVVGLAALVATAALALVTAASFGAAHLLTMLPL